MRFKLWIENQETIPCGDCFKFANNLAKNMLEDGIIPEDKFFVCHGEVEAPLAQEHKRYSHAWVETPDKVYDWQLRMSGKGNLPQKDFYELFKPDKITKYSVKEAMTNQVRHGHHGPWTT